MDNDNQPILQTGSFDPYCSWKTLVFLNPVDDFEKMSEEDRTVAICLETYDGKRRNYRGSATFDRFAGTASYRFLLSVRRVENIVQDYGQVTERLSEHLSSSVERFELRLTKRFSWTTETHKVKGETTSGRWITLCFNRDAAAQTPDSIKQIDLIVPKSKTSDNGKLLALAVNSAKLVVEANIAIMEFEAAKAEMARRQQAT
ncbi:hypothetical protein SEMRO_191_G082280.1 [Seminavis robusta]|uniref:Uncharacterized protein n=1 Tax=Seminavis robusta TaxID=568900 RepID=A0A9N8H940_9STRA|nr:hypothetical protein SEMRO_191_G082280.1 [Seminavis robusta]|eukprot:Sro191_g082280.1 n/a (202) ;mRNA; f:56096-56701